MDAAAVARKASLHVQWARLLERVRRLARGPSQLGREVERVGTAFEETPLLDIYVEESAQWRLNSSCSKLTGVP